MSASSLQETLRRYGISVVSLWPWTMRGPKFTVSMAQEAGFDGIQVLPMRLWKHSEREGWEDAVISWEDAWNYGPLWQAVLRTFGVSLEGAPTLLDLALFSRRHIPPFRKAIPSWHNFVNWYPVEIHPELSLDVSDYQKYCSMGGSLVWDTYHVVRPHGKTGESFGDWRKLLRMLPKGSISLIHVHVVQEDVSGFLGGTSKTLEMLDALAVAAPGVPAILEIAPPLRGYRDTIAHLGLFERTMRAHLG
jgi:hypothetical protein